ncbi:MAG: hypothetical protein AUJ92_07555 [Armatimonadetes bacterium CG2_30_59_28]|nr:MAG: hypothetical protein AUJ92_07555 [Armatimonadetes bacterium CG2_30_59_28]PIU65552.1 MAG: hypothetical protein COS85_08320 [Armatimonadetes bacterium CG07_land_8_20_14_0_80_59_28]
MPTVRINQHAVHKGMRDRLQAYERIEVADIFGEINNQAPSSILRVAPAPLAPAPQSGQRQRLAPPEMIPWPQ